MKIWKLISGILSIILFAVVMFQSCAAGVVDAIDAKGGTSGGVGIIVGILMLAGGILSICVRNQEGKGGDIALIVIFLLAAMIGLAAHGIYTDLIAWGIWCLINAILALVDIIIKSRKRKA
ncbi:MAG: hypothetical protein DUD27_01385 [Lachnospiraceae bacterium]|uniref:Lipoprotein n=1 Tax=Candidatus Weimeria bifida TaxID=2599074 RepID=A0A6N7IX43_9FIRM|nr:hypothetical protein [Candidatus Weimeria bifida]RRF97242.1 MAG: hypothetical protein DUD27_01385 [Lachnospiraceae bacterium]